MTTKLDEEGRRVFIRKLRSKLQRRSAGWDYIHTHFGVGYRFEPETVGIVVSEPTSPPAAAAPDSAQAPSADAPAVC